MYQQVYKVLNQLGPSHLSDRYLHIRMQCNFPALQQEYRIVCFVKCIAMVSMSFNDAKKTYDFSRSPFTSQLNNQIINIFMLA